MKEAQDLLKENLKAVPNLKKAKNVIVFIGDGMGLTSVTTGRIYKGQKKNKAGEDELLSWDTFPYSALVKVSTYRILTFQQQFSDYMTYTTVDYNLSDFLF